jgi:hypothetical protein
MEGKMSKDHLTVEDNNAEHVDHLEHSRFPVDSTRELLENAKTTFVAKLNQQEDILTDEFGKIKAGQNRARELNKLMQKINLATVNGELHIKDNKELMDMLASVSKPAPSTTIEKNRGQDPDFNGIELDPKKTDYKKDELDRLLDNIRMEVDDLNVVNEMQLQNLNRLVTHYHEIYQMMKSIMKPLHDDKINKARSIAGR